MPFPDEFCAEKNSFSKQTFRSLRESVPALPRQEDKKEEDIGEEEHVVPFVQRGSRVRCARGEYWGRQSYSKSNRL